MARNQEKAQSMLYRFRQAQAEELGVSSRHERRPKIIISVTSVRDCDKWRGEVMREISRKVTRIQDFGLTDYEVRDLNDEINQLFREKSMWERQIAALGGANYRSGVPRILDDHGEEIPGMRGYRYYGRAKDLPGVKEHLRPVELEEEEKESAKAQKYKRFQNQPSSYFGNDDEKDGVLLRDEDEAEQLGWKNGWTRIASALLLPEGTPVPPLPRRAATILDLDKMEGTEASSMENKPSKKAKKEMQDTPSDSAPLLPALDAQELVMPPTPSRKDIEAFMLQAKKAALRSEYLGA